MAKKLVDLNILQKFSIVSFVVLLALAFFLGIFITKTIEESKMEQTKTSTVALLKQQTEIHLTPELFAEVDYEKNQEVFELFYKHVGVPEIIRIKVFNREGTIIYSDEPRLIGTNLAENLEIQKALQGEIGVEIHRDLDKEEEHIYERKYNGLIEFYIPLDFGGESVKGVIEAYQILDIIDKDIRNAKRMIWGAIFLGFLILYFALFGIVKDASETIVYQNIELRDYSEHLEEKVKKRTSDLKVANEHLHMEISKHKRAEESLRGSEKRFRNLFNSSLDGVYQTDAEGVFVKVNQAMAELCGHKSPKEMIRKPALRYWQEPKDREAFIAELKHKKALGAYPIRGKKYDSEPIYCENTCRILEDSKGNFIGIDGILRDVTERKRAGEERRLLQRINNMLNAGFELDDVFLTIVDGLRSLYGYEAVAIHLLSSDRKHLVVKSYSVESKAVRKLEKLTGLTILGYEVPLYEGSLLKEIVDTKNSVITDDIVGVLKSYTDKKSLQKMAKAAAKLTKARWGMGAPLLADNKVVGTIGCASLKELTDADVKRLAGFGVQAGLAIEKARAYKAIEDANAELGESNSLKDLFIDIMRHDLLNPAGAARSMTDLALKNETNPEKKEILDIIHSSTGRVISLVENASILAVLESGEQLEFKETDLGDLLRKAAKEMKHQAEEKNVKTKMPIEGVFKAQANPLIYDVFLNLIGNAIKYGPENSEVVAKIKENGSSWKISVADNGEGIPDEYKKGVFDRFKRVKKEGVKGTGLGLAIVKRVVEVHEGRVWVEDNPKGGSVFYVEIPKSRL
ncbi:MAG: ATP-binding protein [Candidatus Hydrothermarchaeales archaeon]